ncbi:phage terminase small subunit [Janthinobacterium fluminis]|uniref:Phage terminase small subunit n=1 Tax=Janthinobacterium fluminis TaxID=2987524 RepID=A0ABT5JXQ0_9BURK|nr:phage terminase small subunit [Janthinobacterium fluminis]MDC8757516.1 phage terminase small subunit [Janthinobacterium fluminis]
MSNPSPAMRHRARILAERTAGASESQDVTTGTAYELMLYKLTDDRRRLKSIQSVERKIEVKATLLPDYAQWIDGVLAGGKGAQDDVFATLLVWHIDTGEYDRALTIAAYAMEHKFTLPEGYSRDIPTMLLDEFAEGYLQGKLNADPQHAVTVLGVVEKMTASSDAPDQARAKLHKAIGLAMVAVLDLADDTDIAPALLELADNAMANLKRARALSEASGVKKEIERLERRIKRAADSK